MKVIVYGTLKKGFHANHLLGDSTYLGAYTKELPYAMYDLGSFPALVASKKKYLISFEMYDVPKAVMDVLDRYEGYPSLYDKDTININGVEAIVYVMKNRSFLGRTPMEEGIWTRV